MGLVVLRSLFVVNSLKLIARVWVEYINECDGKAEACKQAEKRVELSEQVKECNLVTDKKTNERG